MRSLMLETLILMRWTFDVVAMWYGDNIGDEDGNLSFNGISSDVKWVKRYILNTVSIYIAIDHRYIVGIV